MPERVYDGSFDSEILFKVRSQSFEVNSRTHRWNESGSRECRVCGIGAEECVSLDCARFHSRARDSSMQELINILARKTAEN